MPLDLAPWLFAHAGTWSLAFARAAGLAWTAPGLAAPGLGARTRLMLAVLLGVTLAPAVVVAGAGASVGPGGLAVACLGEAAVGAMIGWSAALVIAGARQAGELVGAQGGFAPAALFDPDAGDEMTALGHLYGLVALGVFLALDGPLVLVRSLVASYRVVPAGGALAFGMGASGSGEELAALAFGRLGAALALSLRAAAPAALALALAGVALGLVGRAAPSLPLAALSLPIRAALGLVAVAVGLAGLAAVFAAAWAG